MKALQIEEPEKTRKAITDEMSKIKDAKYVRRLDALLLVTNGKNAYEVSEIFGFTPKTLENWINAVNKSGNFEVLKDKEHQGRPMKLSKEQLAEIKETIEKPPTDSGYEVARWDGKLLSEHIKNKYSVGLKVRRCQELFHELGFTYRRPRKMAYGSSPEAKNEFKKKLKK